MDWPNFFTHFLKKPVFPFQLNNSYVSGLTMQISMSVPVITWKKIGEQIAISGSKIHTYTKVYHVTCQVILFHIKL